MIGLPRSRLPRGFLTRQHDCQAIEVGDDAAIDGLVEREQPCLVCQKLADGDSLFALLRELRPVRAHPFFVVEPPPRVGDRQRHRGQPLGGRVDDHHGVLLPGLARLLVPDTAPEIDDLLAADDRHSRRRPVPGGRAKLSANALRTASKPRLTCPSIECDAAVNMVPPRTSGERRSTYSQRARTDSGAFRMPHVTVSTR